MGKKRSKTSKQKQSKVARETKKNNFGVSMKKGGGRERLASSILLDPKNAPNKFVGKKRMLGNKPKQGQHPQQIIRGKGRSKNEEQEAFRQEMQSLQERHNVSQQKECEARTVKKKMLLQNMKAATLIIDDSKKSTKRLMNETTAEVGKLSGIGIAVQANDHFFPSNKLQVLAQHHREAWSEEQPSTLLGSDNPYSVLHNDSEEEEEQKTNPPKPAVQLFQFASPSFTIRTGDIDPDL